MTNDTIWMTRLSAPTATNTQKNAPVRRSSTMTIPTRTRRAALVATEIVENSRPSSGGNQRRHSLAPGEGVDCGKDGCRYEQAGAVGGHEPDPGQRTKSDSPGTVVTTTQCASAVPARESDETK